MYICIVHISLMVIFVLQRLWATIRVMVALWVGGVLLVSNFGSWYADKICTRTQYKAHVHPVGAPQTIQAEVGLSIGLRGMNITLLESNCEFRALVICSFPDACILMHYIQKHKGNFNLMCNCACLLEMQKSQRLGVGISQPHAHIVVCCMHVCAYP